MARSFSPLKRMLFQCIFWHLRKGVKNDFMLLGVLVCFFFQVVPPLTFLNYWCLPQTVFLQHFNICKSLCHRCAAVPVMASSCPQLFDFLKNLFSWDRINSTPHTELAYLPSLCFSVPNCLYPFSCCCSPLLVVCAASVVTTCQVVSLSTCCLSYEPRESLLWPTNQALGFCLGFSSLILQKVQCGRWSRSKPSFSFVLSVKLSSWILCIEFSVRMTKYLLQVFEVEFIQKYQIKLLLKWSVLLLLTYSRCFRTI